MWASFDLHSYNIFFLLPSCDIKILSFIPLMEFVDLRFYKNDDLACPTTGVNKNSLTLILSPHIQ
jgi:hypothetical protein